MRPPFFDGVKCFACEGSTPYFDLGLRRCIAADSVDENRVCINPSFGKTDAGSNDVEAPTAPTYKDVVITPLEAEPIVKSVTYNKEKKTIDKIVAPIEGKTLVDKERTKTSIKYVEVEPEETEPEVQMTRKKRTSRKSSKRTSSSSKTEQGATEEKEA